MEKSRQAPDERPAVSVGLPVLNEEHLITACLEAVMAQSYGNIVEVLVADGGSTDRTRELVTAFPDERVQLLDNPRGGRPSGLNVAIAATTGEIFVRVDARTKIAGDYVERCVDALERSHAAMVGGPMRFTASTPIEQGIRAAMMSRFGAGPAQFRREHGAGRFVDTVYLGAYRVETVRRLGCYDADFGGNEDAELAWRAQGAGGVYLDPAISSTYAVREGFWPLWEQFRRYGRARAVTIRKHPNSLSPRQVALPALMCGLLSPWRRSVAASYGAMVVTLALAEAAREDTVAGAVFGVALPVMHAAWVLGFLEGLARR